MKCETYLDEKALRAHRVSFFTLRNFRHLRKGPPYLQIGRSIPLPACDVTAFMEQKRIDPESLRGKAV